MQIQGRQEVA